MGLIDKIKNALFEVEYVEVEDTPKKDKKEKKVKEEKPIAKKIVLPGKKEQKVEELHEEELRDEDFEIRPKDETIKQSPREDFKYMDDNDFKVDEDEYLVEEPQIVQVIEPEEEILEEKPVEEKRVYPEKTSEYYQKAYATPKESKPYGMDHSYNVPVHEYGAYERREEKTGFRPSPIISPIYGILDKNYRKEDVREKREVRITSSYSRNGVSVDDIRNKAYGEARRSERRAVEEENVAEVEEEKAEENVMVDLNDKDKPEVKEITMGDALEYFQDLGLEYNVDYVDASKEKSTPKRESLHDAKKEEIVEEKSDDSDVEEALDEDTVKEVEESKVEEKSPEKEKNDKESIDDNDNLFDLIDSMYQEND